MPIERNGQEASTGHGPDGYHWCANGQSTYSGKSLRLFQRLEKHFLAWAAEYQAVDHMFPTFISAAELNKIDYLRSFQHLATFPSTLEASEANLNAFAAGEPLGPDGVVHLTQCAPVRDVLTPAACYHFYSLLQNTQLQSPRYLTTRNTCFRREASYTPMQRQWSFSMREIVCIGTSEEVSAFLDRCGRTVELYFKKIDLPIEKVGATDPFFNPSKNPKFFAQKLAPLKSEMVFESHLAIASINFHRSYFGEAFGLTTSDGEPAYSGCVAFGIDRWIYAFTQRFGDDETRWPLPPL
jgi:seryl-tRNA synthetase